MPLTIKESSGNTESIFFRDWNITKEQAEGVLENDSEISFIINYPLPIIIDKEDYTSCKIFLFKNRFGSKEDQCFNIEIDKKRKGVLFPITIYSNQGILPPVGFSKESDFFYRFLHIGYYHLLDCNENLNKTNEVSSLTNPNNLKIEDFYDDETVIFLFYGTQDEISTFNIKLYYPQLIKCGYVPILQTNDFFEIENIKIPRSQNPLYSYGLFDNIRLNYVNNQLLNEKYISQLFETTLKYSLPPLSKFILLYQVIELLIDKIAIEHFKSKKVFASDFSVLMINADNATSFRDVFDNVKKITDRISSTMEVKNEESRINKLFNDRCKLNISDYPKLELTSKILLAKKSCTTLTDYIYSLRNKIIHDYHNLSNAFTNIDSLLFELNFEFENLIFDIIIKYK